jgi:hypothetical protein
LNFKNTIHHANLPILSIFVAFSGVKTAPIPVRSLATGSLETDKNGKKVNIKVAAPVPVRSLATGSLGSDKNGEKVNVQVAATVPVRSLATGSLGSDKNGKKVNIKVAAPVPVRSLLVTGIIYENGEIDNIQAGNDSEQPDEAVIPVKPKRPTMTNEEFGNAEVSP